MKTGTFGEEKSGTPHPENEVPSRPLSFRRGIIGEASFVLASGTSEPLRSFAASLADAKFARLDFTVGE